MNLHGDWPFRRRYPKAILVNGRPYVRALWRFPRAGVAAQYREDRPERSRHLLVFADGTWCVDHIDAYNPDHGYPLHHFWQDVVVRFSSPRRRQRPCQGCKH